MRILFSFVCFVKGSCVVFLGCGYFVVTSRGYGGFVCTLGMDVGDGNFCCSLQVFGMLFVGCC